MLQTDFNGIYNYSGIRFIKVVDGANAFTVLNSTITNGTFQIQVNEPTTLSLFSASGMLMMKKKFTPGLQTISLSNYTKGLYFLKGKDVTQKIVIE